MNPLDATMAATKALTELLLALTGHLHDRGVIDRNELARLLEGRMKIIESANASDPMLGLLQAQINWLMRLGSGMPEPD
jgi:hypothetical protein